MKKLKVPFVESMDALDLSSLGFVFETRAQREYIDVINWNEYPYKPIVAFDIARTNNNLYISYFVKGNSIKAAYDIDNSPVHKDSCIEFFMKKVEDTDYMNFEFNCIGTCDAARRQSREIKTSLTANEYTQIRRYSTIKHQAFDERMGIYSWNLIIAIPFTLMGLDPEHLPEKILGNFYKCADDTENPHFVSWSPIDLPEPNFHCPDFFGEIYL